MLREFAPAKVNLALHVVDRLPDGRHALESPVAFAAFGDTVTVEPAEVDSLHVDGPFAAALSDEGDNLVTRARDALRAHAGVSTPVAIGLTKRIPVAAGLGGGSADAGATLRALRSLWRVALDDRELAAVGAPLGADVAMCVLSRALIARGVGDRLVPVEGGSGALDLDGRGLVLVNPGVVVPTGAVFEGLAERRNASLPPVNRDPIAWLAACRNDLEAPASVIAPAVGDVLGALRDRTSGGGVLLARMSGSGATCFAVTADEAAAAGLADRLAADHPAWFVASTRFQDRAAEAIASA